MQNKRIIIIVFGILFNILIITSGVIGVLYFKKINKVVTTVTLDINPSIQFGLNYKRDVIKVEGLNEDGKTLIKEENLKGDDIEDAIEEITELVIQKGYIKENDNYILVNVSGEDIKQELSNIINEEFIEKKVECNIIFQEINEEAKANAKKYGISESKASYIESIINENTDLTFEELKDKSINEINEKINNKETQKENNDNKEEENKKEENNKKEDNKQNATTNNNSSSTNTKPNKKPVSTPPSSTDRTGLWCEFYKTIPPEGGVEYETPGYINDLAVYAEAAKKIMPSDADWSQHYESITQYKTASYCSAGIVELENYDKSKTYTAYLDSVTLELLEPIKVKEIAKPNIDEAGAKVIVAKWLLDTYGVDINNCDWESYYYAIDGSTKKPEWQFTCKIEAITTYYAVVVNAITGSLSLGRTW